MIDPPGLEFQVVFVRTLRACPKGAGGIDLRSPGIRSSVDTAGRVRSSGG